MSTKKTNHEGWECEPMFRDAVNCIDELQYYNGDIYTRKFINWIDNVGYDLYISKKNNPCSLVKWRIQESNKVIKLNITIYPYLFNTGYKIFYCSCPRPKQIN